MKRSKQSKCVYDNNGDGVDSSDYSGDKHLTHLSQVVDCYLTERSKQSKCVVDDKDDSVKIVVIVVTSTSHISHKGLLVV
eukprot:7067446-Ditylum_brightwellii.AAC.1